MEEKKCLRVLCPKIVTSKEPGLQWLIGSPFFKPFTIISSFRCLHTQPNDPFAPDYPAEADDLRSLLLRGFDIIGAVYVTDANRQENAIRAMEVSHRMNNSLSQVEVHDDMIGAIADLTSNEIEFFIAKSGKSLTLEAFGIVVYDDNPEKYIWETGCLLRSEMMIKLPIYFPINSPSDAEGLFYSVVAAAAAKLRNSQVAYMVEGANVPSEEGPDPIILHGTELDFSSEASDFKFSKCTDTESSSDLPCSYFCSKSKLISGSTTRETAGAIQITALVNQSRNTPKTAAPIAEFFPSSEPARLLVISFKLDVLCYASKDLSIAYAISKLIVPGLVDQLTMMKKATAPFLFSQLPQLCPHHFFPLGILHPITAIYELRYGEMEIKQAEVRKLLHLRLGLPVDRPLLRVANSLNFINAKSIARSNEIRNSFICLRNVHVGLLGSGVSGGVASLVQGSYEYHHYLQDGFDDNGWGCAYRSLQTIISWFKLQHYTSIEVPSHREIQQALVEIGDKEVSFIGSREWIGAVELSFVLDKLLGVSCKIINVRSGAELPEKCRELALHFETQGTPIMIGGGVLAYTLLGVDYNEVTGECAFLILDPHYTGGDELKRIVNGGWCGWKKAIDKDRSFFLRDKFYNLLLPQRPNMV